LKFLTSAYLLFFVLAVSGGLNACTSKTRGVCTSDEDCLNSKLCKEQASGSKTCVEPTPTDKKKSCKKNSDCGENQLCRKQSSGENRCEKPSPVVQKFLATVPCYQGIPRTSSGTLKLRTAFVSRTGERIVFSKSNPLDLSKVTITRGDDSPMLLSAENGEKVERVSVSITINTKNSVRYVQNPQYAALQKRLGAQRVPVAMSFLLDMSETAAVQDRSLSRLSALASKVLSLSNQEKDIGSFDLIHLLMLRGGRLTPGDDLYLNNRSNYKLPNGKFSSFVPTTSDNVNLTSLIMTNTSNSKAEGTPPLYDGIVASLQQLRSVAYDSNQSAPLRFHPLSLAISLERDANVLSGKTSSFSKAMNEVNDGKLFIPVSSIVYPKPSTTSQSVWDAHVQDLCKIAQKAGEKKEDTFANVMTLAIENRWFFEHDFQSQTAKALESAFYLSQGFEELSIQYELRGATPGQRYIVSFGLEYKNEENKIVQHRAFFEVRP
jgi:hypothetical protein